MNSIKKYSVLAILIVLGILVSCVPAYAAGAKFTIDAPNECSQGETIDVKVTLSAGESLKDSDVFLVYETGFFEYVSGDDSEHNASKGEVRLRGDFSSNAKSCEWTVKLKAKKSGSTIFDVSDKWVQNATGNVIDATSEQTSIKIGTSSSNSTSEEATTKPDEGDNDSTEQTLGTITQSSGLSLTLTTPKSIPSCFSETKLTINNESTKAWSLNDKMQDSAASYSAKSSDFYAVYGYTTEGEEGWYLYDKKEETFQRLVLLSDVDIKATDAPKEEKGNNESSPELLNNAVKVIVIAFVVLIILLIVINILFTKSNKREKAIMLDEKQRKARERMQKQREIEKRIREKRKQELMEKMDNDDLKGKNR